MSILTLIFLCLLIIVVLITFFRTVSRSEQKIVFNTAGDTKTNSTAITATVIELPEPTIIKSNNNDYVYGDASEIPNLPIENKKEFS